MTIGEFNDWCQENGVEEDTPLFMRDLKGLWYPVEEECVLLGMSEDFGGEIAVLTVPGTFDPSSEAALS